eukprot:scaffold2982_cov154-Isochrysis_galbana.AAC.3
MKEQHELRPRWRANGQSQARGHRVRPTRGAHLTRRQGRLARLPPPSIWAHARCPREPQHPTPRQALHASCGMR